MNKIVSVLTLIVIFLLSLTITSAQDWNAPIPACTAEDFAQINAWLDQTLNEDDPELSTMRHFPNIIEEYLSDDFEWTDKDFTIAGYSGAVLLGDASTEFPGEGLPNCTHAHNMLDELSKLYGVTMVRAYSQRVGEDFNIEQYMSPEEQFAIVYDLFWNVPTE